MSDGKKEKSSGILKKKHKRFLLRLLFLIVIGGSGLALWKPEIIQNESQRQRVIRVRDQIGGILGSSKESVAQTNSLVSKVKQFQESIPKGVVLGEQDIYVEDAIKAVSTELEALPGDYYSSFKSAFCADVVATASAKSS